MEDMQRSSNIRSRFLMYCQLFCVLLYAQYASIEGASTCRRYAAMQNDAAVNDPQMGKPNTSVTLQYTCPGPNDPKHYTECCSNEATNGCCAQARFFYEIDRTLATVIAVSVTSSCVLFTIVIAICCFWSRCPLYSACRTQYSHDIATYGNVSKSDDIDMDTMPRELSGKKHNKFSPTTVSNGNLPIGTEIEIV